MWLAQRLSADWLVQNLAMTQNGLVPMCVPEKVSVLGWPWALENPMRGGFIFSPKSALISLTVLKYGQISVGSH